MGHFSGTETYWDGYSAWPFFIPKEPHQSQQRTRKVAYFFTLKRTKTGRRNGLLPKPNWTTYIRSDTVTNELEQFGIELATFDGVDCLDDFGNPKDVRNRSVRLQSKILR